MTLELGTDRVRLRRTHHTRHPVRASGAGVSALLLGNLQVKAMLPTDSLKVRDQATSQLVQRLFPAQQLWRSTLDDLPSRQA